MLWIISQSGVTRNFSMKIGGVENKTIADLIVFVSSKHSVKQEVKSTID